MVGRELEAGKRVGVPSEVWGPVEDQAGWDEGLHSEGALLKVMLPCKRLVYAPTGKICPNSDDVRSYARAAAKGVNRSFTYFNFHH